MKPSSDMTLVMECTQQSDVSIKLQCILMSCSWFLAQLVASQLSYTYHLYKNCLSVCDIKWWHKL